MIEAEQELSFRRFTMEYLPNVLYLESESYPEPWTHGMFRQELANPNSHIYMALRGDAVVGYAGFWLVLDEAHITRVTVGQKYRRLGYGQKITEYMLSRAYDLGASLARLEVRETNEAARKLYDQLGFVVEGRRIGYYQRTNEDAVLMVKRF